MAVGTIDRSVILQSRARTAFALAAAVCFGIVCRLFYLQGLHGEAIRAQAITRRTGKIPLPARRGAILDRNGTPCAFSVATENVGFDPSLFAVPLDHAPAQARREQQLSDSITLLSAILNTPREAISSIVDRARQDYPVWISTRRHAGMDTVLESARFAPIARGLNSDMVSQFNVNRLKLTGFWLKDDTRRSYLLGDSALQVVGYVNDFGVPVSGLELTCNRWLDEKPGYLVAERDGRGRQIPGTERDAVSAKNGTDIYLTIDRSVQQIVREELETAFARYHPNGAEAIVVDCATGDILAMVSLPTFDPNRRKEQPNEVYDHIGQYQQDRCVCRVYEPGSTLKTLAIAAAIDRGIITENNWFRCDGSLHVFNRTIHDSHNEVHGELNPEDILRVSCNVCTAQIGMRMGLENLYDALGRFGLGTKPETLLPLEQRGRMPIPVARQFGAQAARVAFGQSITTTPLHLAMAYAALANGGTLMKPRLISKMVRDGRTVKEFPVTKVGEAVSPRTSAIMLKMLENVVSRGTGRPAAIRGFRIAGKTGTASKYREGAYVGSFAGILPVSEQSKFRTVVLVAIDEPHGAYYGADVAAPVFQQIASRMMTLRGVAEDDPTWSQFKMAHAVARDTHH